MSLQSVLEFGVCFNSFLNVDLNQQGLYRLSASIARGADALREAQQRREEKQYQAKDVAKERRTFGDPVFGPHSDVGAAERATPYAVFETQFEEANVGKRVVPDSKRQMMNAKISDKMDVYYSKSFFVRYMDEKRVLNDGVHFRTEVDSLRAHNESFRLCICLEWAKPSPLEAERPAFEILNARFLQLNYSAEGFHEYVPLIFDDFENVGFALVEMSVHSSVTSLRFEPGTSALRFHDYLARSYYKSGAEIIPDITDEEFLDHLERTRHACLFSLKRCHTALDTCIGLLLDHVDPEKLDLIKATGMPLKQLEQIQTTMKLRNLDESMDLEELASKLCTELDEWSSCLLLGWHSLLQGLKVCGTSIIMELKDAWLGKAREKVGESILRDKRPSSEMFCATRMQRRKERLEIAEKIRKSTMQIRNFQREKLEDFEMFEDAFSYPIVFHEEYVAAEEEANEMTEIRTLKQSGEGKDVRDVYVLIHGFMGSSWDLRPFRNYLSIIKPGSFILCSRANEDDTDTDIEVLGRRLARELRSYLKRSFFGEPFVLGKVSFVCHSIGSVVLRSALEQSELSEYVPHFGTLLSLASPHLGSRMMDSTIVKYGMWAMRHWRKAAALAQLSMSDKPERTLEGFKETLIYKLSKGRIGLRHFEKVVLVSSSQDQYVPYHSSRIEPAAEGPGSNPLEVALSEELCKELLKGVSPAALVRLDLCFQFDKFRVKKLDKVIGRAAHIRILDSPALAFLLILKYF